MTVATTSELHHFRKAYAYNAVGDVTERADTSGSTWSYGYDAQGRMASVTEAATLKLSNLNDYAGRRVGRAHPHTGAVTHYVYDASGRPLAEYDGTTGTSGAPIREYIWLGEMVIAMVDGAPAAPPTCRHFRRPSFAGLAGRRKVRGSVCAARDQSVRMMPEKSTPPLPAAS